MAGLTEEEFFKNAPVFAGPKNPEPAAMLNAPVNEEEFFKSAPAYGTPSAKTEEPAPSVARTAGQPSAFPPNKVGREEPKEMAWGDVASSAAQNIVPSAKAFGHALVTPFMQPKETAQALGQIGTGLYSKAQGALGYSQDAKKKAEDEAAVNQMGQLFKERYGTIEAAKRTFAEDPVGFLADVSTPLTGGGSLAARAPGVIGTLGKATAAVGSAVDPLTTLVKAPQVAAKAISTTINMPAALQSGAAFKSLQSAHDAGVTKNPVFWEHYTGQASAPDLIQRVKNGVQEVAQERSANYLAGMDPIKARTGLDYTPVNDVIQQARGASGQGIGAFHGIQTNEQAQNILTKIEDKVKEFQSKPPGSPAHTLQGFDNLKQAIGNLRYEARGNAQAERVVDQAYDAVKKSIVKVDPDYAKLMDQYGEASRKLNDMHKALLSGGSTDARINKILKSYKTGDKGNLLKDLAGRDKDLMYAISGYDLKPWFPGGLRGTLTSVGLGGLSFAGLGGVSPAHLVQGAITSPRIAGGISYGLGRAGGAPERVYTATSPAVEAARQAGRAEDVLGPQPQARGGRARRASGGRLTGITTAAMLMAAAERAKKGHGKATEPLLNQSDEAITRALAIANQHS
jgi:hypothetical protein